MPLISVIIPTYNRKPLLQEAIDSVLAQTWTDMELIVVDDGSTDETSKMLASYGQRLTGITTVNRGVSAARNRGLAIAQGELIAFLDSDDLWLPTKLSCQVSMLHKERECALCHTNEVWLRGDRRIKQKRHHLKSGGRIFQRCLQRCVISPSSVLVRRSVLQETGGFDESFPVCEDYELWLRICARYPVAYLEERLTIKRAIKRDDLGSQLSQRWGLDVWRVQALIRILQTDCLDAADRTACVNELRRKSRLLSFGFGKHGKPAEAAYFEEIQRHAADRASLPAFLAHLSTPNIPAMGREMPGQE